MIASTFPEHLHRDIFTGVLTYSKYSRKDIAVLGLMMRDHGLSLLCACDLEFFTSGMKKGESDLHLARLLGTIYKKTPYHSGSGDRIENWGISNGIADLVFHISKNTQQPQA